MQSRKSRRNLYVGAMFLVALAVLAVAQGALERTAAAQGKNAVQAPRFEVDPFWPKPLPNHWVVGSMIGVSVDAQDHVWIVHRTQALNANEAHRRRDCIAESYRRVAAPCDFCATRPTREF